MLYSKILKLNIHRIAKAVLLFIDALIVASVVMYVEQCIIMLCYDFSIRMLSLFSIAAIFALYRTLSFMAGQNVVNSRPKFFKVLQGALVIGISVGIIVNTIAEAKLNISVHTAMTVVSLLSSLLVVCVFYICVRVGRQEENNA